MRFLRLVFLHMLALLGRPFVRRERDHVRRILYLKPDHLGDMLLATPVLAALHEHHPNAHITALVGPWSRMVLERNPHVDAVLTCPFPGFERAAERGQHTKLERAATLLKPYMVLLRYAMLLRPGGYDLAIIGRDDHWWGAVLALLAGIPHRIGFAVPECRPFLNHALPWHPNEHVTRQGLALVAASAPAGANMSAGAELRYSARFTPTEADSMWAEGWLAEHLRGGERLVIIHPGTGGPAKHWLDERWSEVADALLARPGTRVALTGGPGEEARVARVAGGMRGTPLVLAGKTSVGQLAALMERAALVLGVDSGPLHLAAAVGAPTVHLYGPGDNGRFGPWGDPAKHVVLHTELWCRPCGVFSACPRGLAIPECMERLSVQAVERSSVEAFERWSI